VFYEGQQVTVNMFEVPSSEALLEHNRSVQHDLRLERPRR
jgi:hypothetical protein